MNKIVKGLVVTGLAVTGFMGVATFATPQVNASRVHYVKWNKPMKHHLVAVNGRKASWKGYTLKKVSNKHYRFKTAAKLNSNKYQVHNLTTLRHAKIDNSIYYGVRVGKKGKMVWVNRKYLTGFVENLTSKTATTKKTTTIAKKSTSKTTKKISSADNGEAYYIKSTKHITWADWLALPARSDDNSNGLVLYNVDNVPYDEDGFPYVSNKLGAGGLIPITDIKSEFSSSAYATIPDKANTFYWGATNVIYHPTNPEVGQAIRDQIPSDTNFDNARNWSETKKVADLSSNFYIAYMHVGDTKKVQMWSGTVGGLKLSDLQMNSYTMTSANPAVVTAPSQTTNGTFTITATGTGKSSVTVRSINNPKLSLRIDVTVS